jgi:hypothetical protein
MGRTFLYTSFFLFGLLLIIPGILMLKFWLNWHVSSNDIGPLLAWDLTVFGISLAMLAGGVSVMYGLLQLLRGRG